MDILIASNNENKITEIREIFNKKFYGKINLLSPKDKNINIDPEETGDTLEENALIKAKDLFEAAKMPVFSDDTGLFIDSLDGEPGVKSARYAGEDSNDKANRELVLKKLEDKKNRDAHFETVICYYDGKDAQFVSGKCSGFITENERGDSGFGYDPIFLPVGHTLTFAEMDQDLKNQISHRTRAVNNFITFLRENVI